MATRSYFLGSRILTVFVAAAACGVPALAAEPDGTAPASAPPASVSQTWDDNPEKFGLTIRMQVSPAAEPTAALKFRFLVPPVDQVHSNAATFYYKAMVIEGPDWMTRMGTDKQILSWLETPIEQLPIDAMKKQLSEAEAAGFQAALAEGAHADFCDWGDPIREFGVDTRLDAAQKMRNVARILALVARLQIAEHRHDEAIETLRLNYALSRNLGHSPTIVQSLIGMAIDGVSNEVVRELIAEPGSPNLYWALSELASRPVELREGMSYETRFWDFTIHNLGDLERRTLTPDEALGIAKKLWKSTAVERSPLVSHGPWGAEHELALVASALAVEPEARAYLVEHGYGAERIEAMPILQRVLLYRWLQFAIVRDNSFKWTLLPADEAREAIVRLQAEDAKDSGSEAGSSFVEALPAAFNCLGAQLRKQREINLLRTVEALRIYAAEHGEWPRALADVRTVPVPLDSVTGNPFDYSVTGNVATLSAPGKKRFPSDRQFFATQYELTLRQTAPSK
jgi:hypothetical protein